MTWPLVDPNDDGIRPAGKSNQCFYCHQYVGQPHKRDCVIVKKRIEMHVTATLPTGETYMGKIEFDEPYSYDARLSEYCKNDSSSCQSNFLRSLQFGYIVTWDPGSEGAMEKLKPFDTDETCLCGMLLFKFIRVVDDTPRRKLNVSRLN